MSSTIEQLISVTPQAADEVRQLCSKPENEGKSLRVFVEAGGCSGMQYSMTFDQQREGDLVSDNHGLMVLVDPFSAQYLMGAVVDFSDSLTAGGFKVLNPAAAATCGCGKSFMA